MNPSKNIGKITNSKIWRKYDEITQEDYINQLSREGSVHLIGIGGSGMSALARVLANLGIKVTGSDLQNNPNLLELSRLGIKSYLGHKAENLPPDCKLVIRSAAIPLDNPEVLQAINQGVRIIKYSKMLGLLMRQKYGIAVSGSHGKTTTTSLISFLLVTAGKDPSYIIGGNVPDLKGNAHFGKGEYFIAEACEYDRSFHNLFYKIAIILNIEPDHLDYYRDISEIIQAFNVFASHTFSGGCIIVNADDLNVMQAIQSLKHKIIKFGLFSGDWQGKNIRLTDKGWAFEVYYQGKKWDEIIWQIPGRHNVYNALATIATGSFLGVEQSVISYSLSSFKGVDRRFQLLGKVNDVLVIDDYAHHPTKIKAVLETARENFPGKHLWCVFQPHQASRTRIFLDQLAESLKTADKVILPDIYFARDSETAKKEITSKDLMNQINKAGGKAIYIPSFSEIVEYLRKHLSANNIVITMGAGDIWKVAHQLVDNQ